MSGKQEQDTLTREPVSIREQLDPVLLDYIDQVLEVCSLRASYVINHILEHGSINSEDLRNRGYVHGARAVGDVRDNGVPLITKTTKSSDNRNIAEYAFGPPEKIKRHKFGGRINFPSTLKKQLIERDDLVCKLSQQELPREELQVDHRIPFYIAGDIKGERNPDDFMLLSRSMQRAKSWSCEHCENLLKHFDPDVCKTCYWAYPENYSHVAMKMERRINIVWQGDEVQDYERLASTAIEFDTSVQNYLKGIVRKQVRQDED